jgi:transcriptional regulator with XRE-family HTH domain
MVSELLRQSLGARVRAARLARGMSLSEAADTSGLSKALLSVIERGEGNPSVNTLFQLATALGTTVSYLIDAEDGGPALVRAGEGRLVAREDDAMDARLLFSASGHRRFEIYDCELPPRSRSEWSQARGAEVTEYITIREGHVRVGSRGGEHRLGPGDSIALRLDGPCHIESGDASVRLTCVTAYGY